MRVAFLASPLLDPDTPRSWSGLPYFMRRALEEAGLEMVTLRAHDSHGAGRWIRFCCHRWLRGRRYLRYCDQALLRGYGRQYARLLAAHPVDAVFSPSSWLISRLETRHPVIFWTDACFAGIVDFYEAFTRLAPVSVGAGHVAEQEALDRCSRAVYCSQWAADSARRNYAVDPAKISVIPFGGNLEPPPTLEEAAALVRGRPMDRCNLLLVGVDWKRKGVDIAIDALRELRAAGVEANLTVVGCRPPAGARLPAGVEVIPFISKASAEGRQRLRELFARSHFFIMPTRAEAFGIVFAEASAFGLPCLAPEVGGLSSVIGQDVTGRLFPLAAGGDSYARYIVSVLRQPGRYRELALGAAREASCRLNWKVSGPRMADLIAATASSPRALSAPGLQATAS